MANFQGILLGTPPTPTESTNPSIKKVTVSVNGSNKTLIPFPHQYMALESWETTPNQREEKKAYRDDNTRNLTRVTASGHKTAIKFSTRDDLHLADKKIIQKFFTDHESNANERKISLTYWNDESNTYKTGDFYRGNMTFTIKKITDNDIIYKALSFDIVEY